MGQYYYPIILSKDSRIIRWAYSHDFGCGLKLMEHSYVGNRLVNIIISKLIGPRRIIWAGDYADNELNKKYNLHQKCYDLPKSKIVNDHIERPWIRRHFLINHTKSEYVDLRILPMTSYDMTIHPLPILTAEGNGRGCGDYYGINMELAGSWSRDYISLNNTLPKNCIEIIPNFGD